MYVTLEYQHGKTITLVICPVCKSATQITGAKKPLKIRRCWACDSKYVEGE